MEKLIIPFNIPPSVPGEIENIQKAIANKKLSGEGPFNKACAKWISEHTGALLTIMLPSCTSGLEMAMVLADIQPGDEVIMPSFTFTSTANAVVLFGGKPVFVDIDPLTLNLDANKISAAITDRTKAIMPVHYAGVGCEMDKIMDIANRHGLWVIEDAAQGIFAKRSNRPLAGIGHMAAISFHETKNIVCGEGGALTINDSRLLARAEMVRDKGTNRQQFLNGQVDKYTWQDKGGSYLLSELAAAFLLAQLQHGRQITDRRVEIANTYHKGLKTLEERSKLMRMHIPQDAEYNGHIYYIMLNSEKERSDLIHHFKDQGISATTHYVPLHSAPAGKKFGRVSGDLSITQDLSSRILRLPMYYSLSEKEINHVLSAIEGFFS